MKTKKPNQYLRNEINLGHLKIKSSKIEEDSIMITYHNDNDNRDLRLKIRAEIPSFLTAELLKNSNLIDFEVIRVNRYMGYSTMICKNIKIAIESDVLTLEEKSDETRN